MWTFRKWNAIWQPSGYHWTDHYADMSFTYNRDGSAIITKPGIFTVTIYPGDLFIYDESKPVGSTARYYKNFRYLSTYKKLS